ncbi:conserved membrane hypothetical protein [Sphingorhabdus sp. 109]|nr:conserved membrane hypothetical protein [Sphingorhabdus sp. 109]
MPEGAIIKIGAFYSAWLFSLMTVSSGVEAPKQLEEILLIEFEGMVIPAVPAIAAVLGVLMSRMLSPKKDPPLSLTNNVIVTMIMLVASLLWVIEAQPGTLFAFLVAIGMGFSGYSLIELMGEEIKIFVKKAFSTATEFLGRLSKKKED